jgi:hypothetical protein
VTEAFIYDAVRTPRGKGRASARCTASRPSVGGDGLQALRDRNGWTPRWSTT